MSAFGAARQAPLALGLLMLRADPQYPRIAADRGEQLVQAALDDGRQLALRARDAWGSEPEAIAWHCGISVTFSDAEAGVGSVAVFADYVAPPPRITLYRPAILRLEQAVRSRTAGETGMPSGFADLGRLFLAHELYHHFDCERGTNSMVRRHRVRIFGVGRWHWTCGLSSLAEIAAGAFAQQLLHLEFHPALLDLLIKGDK